MASLRKKLLNDGYVYVVDFRYRRERHVISTGTSDKRLAMLVLKDIEGKIVRGTFMIEEYEQKDIRLKAFVDEYFNRIRGTKKESTLKIEDNYSGKLIKIIGNVYVRSVDRKVAEYWRSKLLETVGPVTFNIELRFMKMLFKKAMEYGYASENPFKSLKQLKVQEKRTYMYSNEIKRFFERLDENIQRASNKKRKMFHFKFKLLCEVLLNTGMRREEAVGLTYEQIDFNRNILVVEKSKGKKTREIPMTQRVREIFKELGPPLFQGLTSVRASHKFGDVAKSIGLKNMKLHSLRHTFATMLITMGYDIKVVKDLLGHEDIRVTEIYAKVGSKITQSAMRSFELLQKNGYDLVTPAPPPLLDEKKVLKTECPEQDLNLHALASTSS
jgi:site-specific recombinase XerD